MDVSGDLKRAFGAYPKEFILLLWVLCWIAWLDLHPTPSMRRHALVGRDILRMHVSYTIQARYCSFTSCAGSLRHMIPCSGMEQRNDRGAQYRSGFYYINDDQKRLIEASKGDKYPCIARYRRMRMKTTRKENYNERCWCWWLWEVWWIVVLWRSVPSTVPCQTWFKTVMLS